ncbi:MULTISPECIES: DUF4128 domain-containing protein [unclassified Duganella]|uniref:DUF4128 domain-containing protein n=1 Tax=unclassified Duganella TaxID=2636909 RepID=UPI0008919510|nr:MULTISPECIES: DUF4128 domain-containing protein [unclassified Duganella]SDF81633.1 Bacteriophage related protein of unknown function [Duganella sp. OV458]SDI47893.1 Bacteriophage related protein of unknown function [Duganella sp. OV510]
MSHDIARAAIETRLTAWAKARTPALPCAFGNTAYTPVTGQSYLQGDLLPASTLNPSQGGAHRRYIGLHQVSVRTPAGKGTTESAAISKAIEELFPCAITLQYGGINVHIDNTPSVAAGRPDGSFWLVPVTIKYRVEAFD